MDIDSMIKVLTAHKEGKEIECRALGYGEWRPALYPSWNFGHCEFRIKPEPVPNVMKDTSILLFDFGRVGRAGLILCENHPNLRLTYSGEAWARGESVLLKAEVLS